MSVTTYEIPSEFSRLGHGLQTRVTGETFVPALRWAVGASVYFLAVYYGCNWLASQWTGLPSLYFGWERRIPFVPAMIVPYISEDAFFFIAPFLCLSLTELRRHGIRLMLAINIAAVFFLLFPLRMGFGHPRVGGAYGLLFDLVAGFDRPFNLVPSLHLALLVLLWVIYSRHTRGALRAVVQGWFVLIGLSTLMTRQHHVIDVVMGLALGGLCVYLVPDGVEHGVRSERNGRVGTLYVFGSAACLLSAWWFRPLGLFMLWPAIALAIVAGAYFGLGPSIFRKAEGHIPHRVRLLLGPYLLGAWISARLYRGARDEPCQIAPGVLIGGWPDRASARRLVAGGVTAVLDLTAEFSDPVVLRYGVAYRNIPVLDLTPPTRKQLEEAVQFIDEHVRNGPVYVHCALGRWRSACVAVAYLLTSGSARDVDEAVAMTRAARPGAMARAGRLGVLRGLLEGRAMQRPESAAARG